MRQKLKEISNSTFMAVAEIVGLIAVTIGCIVGIVASATVIIVFLGILNTTPHQ